MNTQTLPGFVTAHLGQAVGAYYDRTADLYAQLWGDDIHLGYWDAGERPATAADRRPATERLIRELVGFAGIAPGSRVLDVGCGHGGPALYLAGRLGCEIDGITLSGEQVGRATARAAEEGLSGRTGFRVADVLGGGIAEGAYDVVWAMESLMHIPDRPAFFEVALRRCGRVGCWPSTPGRYARARWTRPSPTWCAASCTTRCCPASTRSRRTGAWPRPPGSRRCAPPTGPYRPPGPGISTSRSWSSPRAAART
ncbi:SAM-dependent methyltransferase [Catellatospora bangladeshensis]|uniref:SAM-dependent methyltransferase n=1 Tax=Catellatospora bangladeshensis TaxID=310355 RepID=UPI00361F8994